MRTFKLTVTEDELKAIIQHHVNSHYGDKLTIERSSRIHDLTKRLNKNTPEIEVEHEKTEGEAQPTSSW